MPSKTKDTGCNTWYPIDNSLWDEQKCNGIWEKAKQEMSTLDERVAKEFDTAHRIKINGRYCYKPDLFTSKGWCKVAKKPKTTTQNTQRWGFCSTSGNIQFMKVIHLFVAKKSTLEPFHLGCNLSFVFFQNYQ